MTTLQRFFDAMAPLLIGVSDATAVETLVGSCPSGPESLDFYRVLVERNLFKILRDIYSPVRALALRESNHLWARLVRSYIEDHPPSHPIPNLFGEKFSGWLPTQRTHLGDVTDLFEEVADYQWIRCVAYNCADDVGDGFDQRLFVRQYTYDVPSIVNALYRDPDAELPPRRPVILLVYRHLRHHDVRGVSSNETRTCGSCTTTGYPTSTRIWRFRRPDKD